MRYTGTEFFKSADEMMMLFNDMNIDKSEVETSLKNTLEVQKHITRTNNRQNPFRISSTLEKESFPALVTLSAFPRMESLATAEAIFLLRMWPLLKIAKQRGE